MTINALRDVLHRQPFQPFRMQLGDGTEVKVSHPECVAIFPDGPPRIVVVTSPMGNHKVIDLMLVAALHVEGNGESDN